MTSKENKVTLREVPYISPLCVEHIIQTEGPLCASLQQLSEDGDYSWGNEEN